jgi:hypothetical protein
MNGSITYINISNQCERICVFNLTSSRTKTYLISLFRKKNNQRETWLPMEKRQLGAPQQPPQACVGAGQPVVGLVHQPVAQAPCSSSMQMRLLAARCHLTLSSL